MIFRCDAWNFFKLAVKLAKKFSRKTVGLSDQFHVYTMSVSVCLYTVFIVSRCGVINYR